MTHAVELVDNSVNFAVRGSRLETQVASDRPVVVSMQIALWQLFLERHVSLFFLSCVCNSLVTLLSIY
jgi:hypothetical protein